MLRKVKPVETICNKSLSVSYLQNVLCTEIYEGRKGAYLLGRNRNEIAISRLTNN